MQPIQPSSRSQSNPRKAARYLAAAFTLLLATNGRAQTLVGVYHFDEGSGAVAVDSSGFGNDGVIQGPVYVSGYSGTGLAFSGNLTDRVLLPPTLFSTLGNTVYVEAWVFLTQLTSFPYRNTVFIKRADNNDLVMSINWVGTPRCSLDTAVADDAGNVPLNVWTKLGCWYDGTTMRAYVNDGLVSSGVQPLSVDWYRNYFQTEIGNNTHDAPQPHGFHGLIDEVRIATGRPQTCSFGPATPIILTRLQGTPSTSTTTWSSCGGTGTLEIASDVTSAVLTLNGFVIVDPSAFPLRHGTLAVPITLATGSKTLAGC